MAYRARIVSSEITQRQLSVSVEFVDQAGVLPTIRTAYSPHGMSRRDFLFNVVRPELEKLNQLSPLKTDLDVDVAASRWFREVDIT